MERSSTNKINSDSIFYILVGIVLVVSLVIVLYPLYFVVIASVSDPTLVNTGNVWLLPRNTSFRGYGYVFRDNRMLSGYMNTILYSSGFTFTSVTLTVLAAYPLSKRDLFGRRFVNFLIILPMYFSGGLVPTYITVRNLGLVNNPLIMCILGALSTFNVIIARTYFESNIPTELTESADMDGCNQAQAFWRIVLPLSKPILAVLGLYAFVGQWNSYFNAMMFLSRTEYYPLQLVLREILIQGQSLLDSSRVQSIGEAVSIAEQQKLADMIKYCVIIVSTAPLLLIFPFFQRYFAQGVMVGAIKG